eukprot:COSAG03_NODE_2915_length_2358_cov_2.397964_1_plen_83_part_10
MHMRMRTLVYTPVGGRAARSHDVRPFASGELVRDGYVHRCRHDSFRAKSGHCDSSHEFSLIPVHDSILRTFRSEKVRDDWNPH